MNVFKKTDGFLNACVDYFDYRIRTGKFIGDIRYYVGLVTTFVKQTWEKEYNKAAKSNLFFALVAIAKTIWQILTAIPFIKILVSFFGEILVIVVTCYAEIFIVFAFTFPLTILLLNLFQTAIVAFFVALIPILLLIIYCVSALFDFIRHRETGERISLWHSFQILIPRFSVFTFPSLIQFFGVQESALSFILIALFLSFIFDFIHISWSDSFIYWFVVLAIGFFIVVCIFFFSIVLYQTYFTVLLENLSFKEAFRRSRNTVSTFFGYYFFYYLLLYILSAFLIWRMAVAYLYLGVAIGIYIACIVIIFFAFLLWKKFRLPPAQEVIPDPQKLPLSIIVLVVFGFINYTLLAVFFIKEYKPFITFVQQQENNLLATQETKPYTNTTYGYIIHYPKSWTVYEWNKTATTFYNNYTGTISGGTWMTVTVSSYNANAFSGLFEASPGLAGSDSTNNITTKITNTTIQGYDTVNYTVVKQQTPYSQFETHYLIHKGSLVYDIAFISVTNDVANYNSDLYQKIINSFQFTQ